MVDDARQRTKEYLDTYLSNGNLTEDDGTTQVKFAVIWENPPYPIEREFRGSPAVDLLFVVGTPNSSPMMDPVSQVAYGYEEHVPIITQCIDKTGITGTLLRWKACQELRRIIKAYPTGSHRALKEERPSEQHLGSIIVHAQRLVMNYRRDTT